jgi:anti-anti-sigma regulatory factor
LEEELQKRIGQIRCPHVTGIEVAKGVATVVMRGKILDAGAIQKLGEILFAIAEHPAVTGLALDFNDIEYNSPAALGKYITANRMMEVKTGCGLPLGIIGMRPEVYEVFRISQLNKAFYIRQNVDDLHAAWSERRAALEAALQRNP